MSTGPSALRDFYERRCFDFCLSWRNPKPLRKDPDLATQLLMHLEAKPDFVFAKDAAKKLAELVQRRKPK